MGQITKHPFDLKDKPGWLALRDKIANEGDGRLGGSELGAAVGDNPYKSAYALWCEKVGLYVPDDISEKESIKQGVMFEPAVADRFEAEMGLHVEEVPYIITNSAAPHLLATPDRLVSDGESGLECKTAKEVVMKKFTTGEFPMQYFDQCACYLKVTERKRWYIAILVYGVAFNIYMMTTIKEEADRFNYLKGKVDAMDTLTPEESKEWQEKWNKLLAVYYIDQEGLDACELAAANFMNRVTQGKLGNMEVWPIDEIDGSDSTSEALAKANRKYKPETKVVFDMSEEYGVQEDGQVFTGAKGAEVIRLVNARKEYKQTIKELESEADKITNQLCALMGEKETFIVPGGRITYKLIEGTKYAHAKEVETYFAAQGVPVPPGLITKSETKRGIRFYASKPKAK